MRGDVAGRHPAGVERQDLVVKPLKPRLTLANDLRVKRPRSIAGRVDLHLALVGQQPLRGRPVTRVARPTGWFVVGLIAEMVSQLDLQRALHQPLGELAQQSARPGDLLLSPGAGEQLIDHRVGQQRLDVLGDLGRGPGGRAAPARRFAVG